MNSPFFPPTVFPEKKIIIIDFQDDKIEIKETNPSFSLNPSTCSNSNMVFAFDCPHKLSLSAYYFRGEGKAELAWKVSDIYCSVNIATDQWYLTALYTTFSNLPIAKGTFKVFNAITGQETLASTHTYAQCCYYMSQTYWLNGNFLTTLVGKELHIFHIPTKSCLASINVSEQLFWPAFCQGVCSPLYVVQIGQDNLQILYENETGRDVFQIKLENQYQKSPLPIPSQILIPPECPLKTTKIEPICRHCL